MCRNANELTTAATTKVAALHSSHRQLLQTRLSIWQCHQRLSVPNRAAITSTHARTHEHSYTHTHTDTTYSVCIPPQRTKRGANYRLRAPMRLTTYTKATVDRTIASLVAGALLRSCDRSSIVLHTYTRVPGICTHLLIRRKKAVSRLLAVRYKTG